MCKEGIDGRFFQLILVPNIPDSKFSLRYPVFYPLGNYGLPRVEPAEKQTTSQVLLAVVSVLFSVVVVVIILMLLRRIRSKSKTMVNTSLFYLGLMIRWIPEYFLVLLIGFLSSCSFSDPLETILSRQEKACHQVVCVFACGQIHILHTKSTPLCPCLKEVKDL